MKQTIRPLDLTKSLRMMGWTKTEKGRYHPSLVGYLISRMNQLAKEEKKRTSRKDEAMKRQKWGVITLIMQR